MVLALLNFLGGFSTNAIIPVTVNRVVECFNHASELVAIMRLYRLAFSLTMSFFVPAWIEVGFGWCLGMAAFYSVFAYGGIVLLLWTGKELRGLSFTSISSNEGGMRILYIKKKRRSCPSMMSLRMIRYSVYKYVDKATIGPSQ